MRGMTCPDCGSQRMFAGFEAFTPEERETVRVFVCRSCHVMEKDFVKGPDLRVVQRCEEIRPRRVQQNETVQLPA
jgi:NMD protein affecting ribosome stability and mRNA decay